MVWLSLLVLMILVAAAPGISIYVEHMRGSANETSPAGALSEPFGEGSKSIS